MDCPYCGAAVVVGAERCARCDVAIQWASDEATFENPGEFVEVHRAFDPATLPVVESLLAAHDIPYLVANDVTQDMFGMGRLAGGYNNVFGPPLVKVPASRAEEALELLAPSEHIHDTLPEEQA